MSIAKATVSGFIRRKETKFTAGGMAICELSIPVDKKWTDKNSGETREHTSWINVVAMGKQAEVVDKYFEEGRGITVFGEIEIQYWEKDGQKQNKCVIKMENFDFPPVARGESEGAPQQTKPQQRAAPQNAPSTDFDTGPDDIPF